ncbi:MAG: helix-turn-helix domain-containing protein [Candidatus Omnitrophica bacterium]|nr:helix-turn-helix domain-containing protein [Candidatus Omnitrophota bacterium]MBU1922701.1 helix-turn-helix domain-containing protein [Candidatus Omnitrophota bacterium]
MAEEKLLTVRDVSVILGVFEKDVLDLAEKGIIPAYKIGGLYLRFKKDQVEQYKKAHHRLHPGSQGKEERVLQDKIHDFFYFNDFYILAMFLIILLGFLVYRGL